MSEKCNNCKHWEWNIIGVDKKHRPAAGRCFYCIDQGGGNSGHYLYGYEKAIDCPGYREANNGGDE